MKDEEINHVLFKLLTSRASKKKPEKALPTPQQVIHIAQMVRRILQSEPICLQLHGDFVVVGDIHGNVDDMMRIFEKFGYPPANRYLFLGDYVDRGNFSIEVILILYLLKMKFPENIFLLRGNHESEHVTEMYGFKEECLRRLNKFCYLKIIDSFTGLPVAATLNDRIFCVHGGIPKRPCSVKDLLKLPKKRNPPLHGMISDLLWSDPEPRVRLFVPNQRGIGVLFGVEPVVKFLDANKFDLMIRSHELCVRGYDYPFQRKDGSGCKRCLTIFSSGDYCGESNKAAVALVPVEGEVSVEVLEALTEEQSGKKRVQLPEWLLSSGQRKMKPVNMDTRDNLQSVDVLACESTTGTAVDA